MSESVSECESDRESARERGVNRRSILSPHFEQPSSFFFGVEGLTRQRVPASRDCDHELVSAADRG